MNDPREAAYAATHDRADLETQRRNYIRERVSVYEQSIREEAEAIFGARIQAARQEEFRAKRAADEADAAEGLRKPRPFLLGTVMVEFEYPRYCHGHSPGQRRLTGRRGVLEVITPASEHPDNLVDRASPGDLILRLLKKDGTPSKTYVHRAWDIENYWLPEDRDILTWRGAAEWISEAESELEESA